VNEIQNIYLKDDTVIEDRKMGHTLVVVLRGYLVLIIILIALSSFSPWISECIEIGVYSISSKHPYWVAASPFLFMMLSFIMYTFAEDANLGDYYRLPAKLFSTSMSLLEFVTLVLFVTGVTLVIFTAN
jgi:hypothetical protein